MILLLIYLVIIILSFSFFEFWFDFLTGVLSFTSFLSQGTENQRCQPGYFITSLFWKELWLLKI